MPAPPRRHGDGVEPVGHGRVAYGGRPGDVVTATTTGHVLETVLNRSLGRPSGPLPPLAPALGPDVVVAVGEVGARVAYDATFG